MADYTTTEAIIASLSSVIEALTPTKLRTLPFTRCGREYDLRAWVDAAPGAGIFRRFEIVRVGPREEPGIIDSEGSRFERDLEVLIAYPSRPHGLYGADGIRDMGDVIDADAHLLSRAIWDPANLITGANRYAARVEEVLQEVDDALLLPLTVRVEWFELTPAI